MARKNAQTETPIAETGPAWTERLIGHDDAEIAIARTLNSGRMPHAWLISGPKGVGKATLAYRMARRLLSQRARSNEDAGLFAPALPSNETLQIGPDDPVFVRVARQTHPDFRVLEPRINPKTLKLRTEIVIEDVRDVIDFLRLKPALGGYRVVVVDSADDLNQNAANALLKVLEEPPSQAVLVLVAHAPRALLPTLVSRCRRVVLRPLDRDRVAEAVNAYAPKLNAETRELACLLSEGSPGRAIRLAEDDGASLFFDVTGVIARWPAIDIASLHEQAERLAGRGGKFDLAGEMLEWWFCRFLRHFARRQKPDRELFEGEFGLMDRMSAKQAPDRWLQRWERAKLVMQRVRRVNMDRKQAWIVANLLICGRAD